MQSVLPTYRPLLVRLAIRVADGEALTPDERAILDLGAALARLYRLLEGVDGDFTMQRDTIRTLRTELRRLREHVDLYTEELKGWRALIDRFPPHHKPPCTGQGGCTCGLDDARKRLLAGAARSRRRRKKKGALL